MNTEKKLAMEAIKDRKVVEHNDLITSIAKMDKTPLKIFELAVSCIDTDNPPKDDVVYLSKKELFSFFDVSDNDKHTRFKKAVEKMQKQAYFQVREKTGKGFEFESIIPIPTVKWNNYNDEVFIRFNPDIMPYLIDMKTSFTQYAIMDIMNLNSKYSIILYKWLSMFFNQYEHYSDKPNRTQKQLFKYKNPKISVKELRELTDTNSDYARFGNFETNVIKKSISEINDNTHFDVDYEKIKKGRNIDEIQFFITKKKVLNENYKDNDPKAQESLEQKQVENEKLFYSAVGHPYTLQLINVALLQATDIANQERMIGLVRNVYPVYDSITQSKGQSGLTTHLEYVRDKMIDFSDSKKNIVKYLKTSAEQYVTSTSFD
ncbi:RepB family plasmid replication initiator protein [Lactococcus petauri]|uniref:RepB family plasmid replication initiator protein n=1 Tax=Lactococcus petauri TaxID=1940789 RepID=UPI003262CD3F